VSTVSFRLDEEDDEEKELYNDLSRYVTSIQQSSVERQEEKYRFALVILQRRFASSTYALLRSLERRKDRLEEMLKTAELRQSTPQIDYDDIEDMSEEDR
jgi:CII-binding regulator of phage lambda lysogenization HflD